MFLLTISFENIHEIIQTNLKSFEEKVHILHVTDFWSTLTQIKTKSAESKISVANSGYL